MFPIWRALILAAAIAACSSRAAVGDAQRHRDAAAMTLDGTVAPLDASAPSPADASALALLACSHDFAATMGKVSISVDPTTLRGEFVAFDTSKLPMRQIRIHAEPAGSQTAFVFDGYGPRDSTFKGRAVPRSEQLQLGAVVARIVEVGGKHRLVFNGELRLDPKFDQGKWADGYPCP